MKKTFQTTLQKIRQHGYWQIRFLPSEPLIRDLERQEIREILTKSSISLRGWNYPHIPVHNNDHEELYLSGDHFEGWIDWNIFKEIFRVYDNGQYFHLFGAYEDWWSENDDLPSDHPYKKVQVGKTLEVVSVVYRITEIFAFLRNLYDNGFYENDVDVEIVLKNTKGRKLTISDPRRFPLSGEYISYTDHVILTKRTVTKEEIFSNFQDIAMKYIIELFQQFQWDGFPSGAFKQDQKNLLERKI